VLFDEETAGGLFPMDGVGLRYRVAYALRYALFTHPELLYMRPTVLLDARRLLVADANAGHRLNLLWTAASEGHVDVDGVGLLPYVALAAAAHVPDDMIRRPSVYTDLLMLRRLLVLAAFALTPLDEPGPVPMVIGAAGIDTADTRGLLKSDIVQLTYVVDVLCCLAAQFDEASHKAPPSGDGTIGNTAAVAAGIENGTLLSAALDVIFAAHGRGISNASTMRGVVDKVLVRRFKLRLSPETMSTSDDSVFFNALTADIVRHTPRLLGVIAGALQRTTLYLASIAEVRPGLSSPTPTASEGGLLTTRMFGLDAPLSAPRIDSTVTYYPIACGGDELCLDPLDAVRQYAPLRNLPPPLRVNSSAIFDLLGRGIGDGPHEAARRRDLAHLITGMSRGNPPAVSHLMQHLPRAIESGVVGSLALPRPWRYGLYCMATHWGVVVTGAARHRQVHAVRVALMADFLHCLHIALKTIHNESWGAR
jgi:hypothetical protein